MIPAASEVAGSCKEDFCQMEGTIPEMTRVMAWFPPDEVSQLNGFHWLRQSKSETLWFPYGKGGEISVKRNGREIIGPVPAAPVLSCLRHQVPHQVTN